MRFLNAALATIIAGLSLAMVAPDADAARLGGGRDIGAQRAITQKQALPAQPNSPAAAPLQSPAAQPAGASRWLGPLAGIAAGVGLGWLFANSGMGGMFGMLLMGLVAIVVGTMLIRLLARPRPTAGDHGDESAMHYAGLGNETVAAPPPSQLPGNDVPWSAQADRTSSASSSVMQPVTPPGFDVVGFLKQAKINFIRLQDANDRKDYDALRDVTTDELYDSLAADLRSRGNAMQHTDVVTLDATLLEVLTEGSSHRASVKFSGQAREQAGAAPSPFAEVWHLSKPVTGNQGWLIAGIQQIS